MIKLPAQKACTPDGAAVIAPAHLPMTIAPEQLDAGTTGVITLNEDVLGLELIKEDSLDPELTQFHVIPPGACTP